jgi:hypothetical protein
MKTGTGPLYGDENGDRSILGMKTGTGPFYGVCGECFRGRPGARSVDWSPSSWAVGAVHVGLPYGAPRCTLRRKAFSSVSVCAALTCSCQRRGRETGQLKSHAFSSAVFLPQKAAQQAHAGSGRQQKAGRPARKKTRSLPGSALSCTTLRTPGMEAGGRQLNFF